MLLLLPLIKKTTGAESNGLLSSAVDGIAMGDDDFASFLLPRLLRAVSSLEASLLSSERPHADDESRKAQVWRRRLAMRDQLEALLIEVFNILGTYGGLLEWKSRDHAVLPNGLGKAQEMAQELLKAVQGAQLGFAADMHSLLTS